MFGQTHVFWVKVSLSAHSSSEFSEFACHCRNSELLAESLGWKDNMFIFASRSSMFATRPKPCSFWSTHYIIYGDFGYNIINIMFEQACLTLW